MKFKNYTDYVNEYFTGDKREMLLRLGEPIGENHRFKVGRSYVQTTIYVY